MVCLETSFLIDLLRGDKKAIKVKDEIDKSSESVSIASPSVIELIKGLKIGKYRIGEEEVVYKLISSLPVLSLDKKSAIKSGHIEADLIKKGGLIDLEDIMIAAICIENKETLLTRNEKHFTKIEGLSIKSY